MTIRDIIYACALGRCTIIITLCVKNVKRKLTYKNEFHKTKVV